MATQSARRDAPPTPAALRVLGFRVIRAAEGAMLRWDPWRFVAVVLAVQTVVILAGSALGLLQLS